MDEFGNVVELRTANDEASERGQGNDEVGAAAVGPPAWLPVEVTRPALVLYNDDPQDPVSLSVIQLAESFGKADVRLADEARYMSWYEATSGALVLEEDVSGALLCTEGPLRGWKVPLTMAGGLLGRSVSAAVLAAVGAGPPAVFASEAPANDAPEPGQTPALIDAPEAARLLGISTDALYQRIARHKVSGIVRTGRRVQFHRERLLASLERKATR